MSSLQNTDRLQKPNDVQRKMIIYSSYNRIGNGKAVSNSISSSSIHP